MNEQQKTQPTDEIKSAPVTDADLENVSGGGEGSSSVIRKDGGGYSKAKL